MFKISPIQKIAYASMFLILTILGTRLPAMFSIPSFEFVRISLGPAFIILAGIFLGPLYGAIVGGFSDLLGVVVFPTTLGSIGVINPFITLMYTLMGALSWVVYFLIKKIKKTNILSISMLGVTIGLLVFLVIYLLTNDSITSFGGKVYSFNLVTKIIIISISVLLTGGFIVGYIYLNKYFENRFKELGLDIDFKKVAFNCFICEIFISLIMGSIVKSIMYQVDFIVLLFIQSIMFFIDITLNSYIVSLLLTLLRKIIRKK